MNLTLELLVVASIFLNPSFMMIIIDWLIGVTQELEKCTPINMILKVELLRMTN